MSAAAGERLKRLQVDRLAEVFSNPCLQFPPKMCIQIYMMDRICGRHHSNQQVQ